MEKLMRKKKTLTKTRKKKHRTMTLKMSTLMMRKKES